MAGTVSIRIHGSESLPVLTYLPGLHGDDTLVGAFRRVVTDRLRLAEVTYPQTTSWSLQDHADSVIEALRDAGVTATWLLAESFGSQVAWALFNRLSPGDAGHHSPITVRGVVLANGFVRHPIPWGVRFVRHFIGLGPLQPHLAVLRAYTRYAQFRLRRDPEQVEDLNAFLENRTERDRQAAIHRLQLIADHHPQAVVRGLDTPVFYLAGVMDPLVPWFMVRWWLRHNCPGYRGGRTVWRSNHVVLVRAPRVCADQICDWMGV